MSSHWLKRNYRLQIEDCVKSHVRSRGQNLAHFHTSLSKVQVNQREKSNCSHMSLLQDSDIVLRHGRCRKNKKSLDRCGDRLGGANYSLGAHFFPEKTKDFLFEEKESERKRKKERKKEGKRERERGGRGGRERAIEKPGLIAGI